MDRKNSPRFQDLPKEEQEWLDRYLEGTIEADAFEALQDRMQESPGLRAVMRRYLALDDTLRMEVSEPGSVEGDSWLGAETSSWEEPKNIIGFPVFSRLVPLAAAAGLAFLLGLGAMWWAGDRNSQDDGNLARESADEPSAQGFAVVSRLFDAGWPEGVTGFREGDTLGAEVVRLAAGTAEIQFFSGATMTVEGPAEITLKSAWEAACREGAVRMQVPPAARGFRLLAPSTEIVDLGTEFGLVVREGKGHVEVLDGEISLKHAGEGEKIVTKGGAFELASDGPSIETESGRVAFPSVDHYGNRVVDEQRADFDRWLSHRDSLARDERLIAYYAFDREVGQPLVPNLTQPRNPEFDGAVILAEPVAGRWAGLKEAFEFRRPGSRVRVNIPGEFPAFTFAAWVRIDSLDRWYNALFMGDGYETGEPHWQIRDDGKMMLSVMVDDTKPNPGSPNDAGFHRVYYSPPMWDLSMSGQWLHLASVFDPINRAVSHYVNGERISRQEIEDRFFIDTLRIGNAEIGNWGQPFREDPTFAIRNLNGRMDEIAIFRAALQDEEIAELFERSRQGKR